MPRFDFHCKNCRTTFEAYIPFDEVDATKERECVCGGTAKRMMSFGSVRVEVPESFNREPDVPPGFGLPQNIHEDKIWNDSGVGARWV